MKALIHLSLLVIFLFTWNNLFGQSGESKFKKVTLGPSGNKVNQYYSDFRLLHLIYSDSDSDQQLAGNETGSISLYVKNTGTVQLRELIVNVILSDNNTSIDFIRNQSLNNIKVRDSVLVKISLKANETLKNGVAKFEIHVGDSQSDVRKKTQIEIKTKEKP